MAWLNSIGGRTAGAAVAEVAASPTVVAEAEGAETDGTLPTAAATVCALATPAAE